MGKMGSTTASEYGDIQLICEAYNIFENASSSMSAPEIRDEVFAEWKRSA